MKRITAIILLCLIFVGCGNRNAPQEKSQTAAIGNPWSDWASMEEAEAAAGFPFGLPEVIAGSYKADAYRTLNGELIEVIYRDGDSEVRVRKQKGEGQDISGDYNPYDTCTETKSGEAAIACYRNSGNNALKQIISKGGYSWSLTAPDGCWGDSNADFLNAILAE